MRLSNEALVIESLKGEMRLEYVGAMDETAGADLEGASVFRIKNSERYFRQNRDQSERCGGPVRWLALNSATGAPIWSREIWVALLTIEDWSQYAPNAHGQCASGKYVRSGE